MSLDPKILAIAQTEKAKTGQGRGSTESEFLAMVDYLIHEYEKKSLERKNIGSIDIPKWQDHNGVLSQKFFDKDLDKEKIMEEIRDIIDMCRRHNVDISGDIGATFVGATFFIDPIDHKKVTFMSNDFSCTISEDDCYSLLAIYDDEHMYLPNEDFQGSVGGRDVSCDCNRRIEVVNCDEISEFIRPVSGEAFVSNEELANYVMANNPEFQVDEIDKEGLFREVDDKTENKKRIKELVTGKPGDESRGTYERIY